MMFLYGRNSVFERLKINPATIRKIFLEDGVKFPEIEKLIKANNIPLEVVSSRELYRIKPAKILQGIVAKVDVFRYASFDDLLTRVQNNELSLIFLDRINDPQNLGAIIRTIACFGNFAVVIPKHDACEVTETVLHVASGGENYVSVAMVSSLSNAIIKAKECNCWIAGALTGADASDITTVSFPFPLGIVLGFEGSGIRYGVEKNLDVKVRIPMYGSNLSYNVSLACAIFCYEITMQRQNNLKVSATNIGGSASGGKK